MDTHKQDQNEPQPSEQAIADRQAQRLQAFHTELNQLCKRYGVELTTTPVQIATRFVN